MDNVEKLATIDWWYVILALLLLLICVKFVWSLFDWLFVTKLGIKTKKMRQREEESQQLKTTTELAKTNANNLQELRQRQCEDEVEFRDNRKKSIVIQEELKDAINKRDVQIEALVVANKEMLAEKINEKYKYYISINGIPEDEYDEFVSLHAAYKGVGGNSHGDAKFEYCMEHLPIIPVDTKLVIKHKD